MYCIFSFKSRQEAMRLYDTAKRNSVYVVLVSTPKFVQSGCGLSVKTSIENYKNLYGIFKKCSFFCRVFEMRFKNIDFCWSF